MVPLLRARGDPEALALMLRWRRRGLAMRVVSRLTGVLLLAQMFSSCSPHFSSVLIFVLREFSPSLMNPLVSEGLVWKVG